MNHKLIKLNHIDLTYFLQLFNFLSKIYFIPDLILLK